MTNYYVLIVTNYYDYDVVVLIVVVVNVAVAVPLFDQTFAAVSLRCWLPYTVGKQILTMDPLKHNSFGSVI